LRLRVQGPLFKDSEWADYQDIMALSKAIGVVVAVVDTRDTSSKLLYYYSDKGNHTTQTQNISELPPSLPVVKLAYTGNHYLSVKKDLTNTLPITPGPALPIPTAATLSTQSSLLGPVNQPSSQASTSAALVSAEEGQTPSTSSPPSLTKLSASLKTATETYAQLQNTGRAASTTSTSPSMPAYIGQKRTRSSATAIGASPVYTNTPQQEQIGPPPKEEPEKDSDSPVRKKGSKSRR